MELLFLVAAILIRVMFSTAPLDFAFYQKSVRMISSKFDVSVTGAESVLLLAFFALISAFGESFGQGFVDLVAGVLFILCFLSWGGIDLWTKSKSLERASRAKVFDALNLFGDEIVEDKGQPLSALVSKYQIKSLTYYFISVFVLFFCFLFFGLGGVLVYVFLYSQSEDGSMLKGWIRKIVECPAAILSALTTALSGSLGAVLNEFKQFQFSDLLDGRSVFISCVIAAANDMQAEEGDLEKMRGLLVRSVYVILFGLSVYVVL